jgi:hypothetical protein
MEHVSGQKRKLVNAFADLPPPYDPEEPPVPQPGRIFREFLANKERRERGAIVAANKRAKSSSNRSQPPTALESEETAKDIATSPSEYRFEPLEPDQIRLLKLLPSDTGAELLNAKLMTYRLDEAPDYTALSYNWGDLATPEQITVNDKPKHITRSLMRALKAIRQKPFVPLLWVDALCINQNNPAEKNQQIPMMGKIFQKAKGVYVWVGPGDSDSDLAMDFYKRLLSPGFFHQIKERWSKEYGFIALGKLIGREWFCRAWVVQEVAYSKKVLLLCGDREGSWTDFLDAVNLVRSNLESIRTSFHASPYYRNHSDPLDNFSNSGATALLDVVEKVFLRSGDNRVLGRKMSLETLIGDLTPFQATDSRDNIFALAGLAQNWIPPLKVDYEKSVLDVYSDTVSHCILESNSLDIICRLWAPVKRNTWRKDFPDPDLIFRTPSWMSVRDELPFGDPKLKSTSRINADPLVGEARGAIYRACDAELAKVPKVRFGVDDTNRRYDGSLFAKGIELATVTDISTRMADGIVLNECMYMIGGGIDCDESGKVTEVDPMVWRILCANRGGGGTKMPATYRHALPDILRKLPAGSSIDTVELIDTLSKNEDYIAEYLKRMQAVTWNRKVFIAHRPGGTECLLGIAPRDTKAGDKICILFGGSVPFVLREHEEKGECCFELVGAAYVDGYMEGEAVSGMSAEELKAKEVEFGIW